MHTQRQIHIQIHILSQQRNPNRRGSWNSKRQIDVVTFSTSFRKPLHRFATHTYRYINIFVFVYVCVYVDVDVYVYVHVHIHIHVTF